MDLSTALWVALAFAVTVWVLTLRASVRLFAPKVENAWDNAVAYALVCGALLWPAQWLLGQGVLGWVVLPFLIGGTQVWLMRVIYQVTSAQAALLVVLHGAFAAAVYAASLFTVGAIIVYLAYGRVVSDPMLLIRLLAKLIGIEL
jgi:hypothetical protein